jgi:hypothetical protein
MTALADVGALVVRCCVVNACCQIISLSYLLC